MREHTIKYYRSEFKACIKLLREQEIELNVKKWTSEVIKHNVILYTKEKGLKPVSINSCLRALRTFFISLEGREILKNNPMKGIKRVQKAHMMYN